MPGCPIWLWTGSVLRSVWECQRRLSAGSQRWLPESEQAPPRPWLKAEKGKMRSSSWELWVKTAPSAPCVRRALPSGSIRGAFVRHKRRCKLFYQVCGGGFTHGGVPSAVAPGDKTLVWGMLMWLQVRGKKKKKKLFFTRAAFYPPPLRSFFFLLQKHRTHHRFLLNHDPLWNRRVLPSWSRTHARAHAHHPLQWLFLQFDADPRSLPGYAQHLSL